MPMNRVSTLGTDSAPAEGPPGAIAKELSSVGAENLRGEGCAAMHVRFP